MKKIALVFGLGLILSAGAFATTATGTLNLTGTVPQLVSITVNPLAAASALSLDTTTTDLEIANIVVATNDANGFDVTVSSTNGGTLNNATTGESLAYTIDTSATSGAGPYTAADLTGVAPILSSTARTAGTTQYISINYTGNPNLSSGVNFTDTLTFTITGK